MFFYIDVYIYVYIYLNVGDKLMCCIIYIWKKIFNNVVIFVINWKCY